MPGPKWPLSEVAVGSGQEDTTITTPIPLSSPPGKGAEAPSSGPLVDTFGRIADDLRVSVTDRCNFRCTYCMPAEGLDWLPRDATPHVRGDREAGRAIRRRSGCVRRRSRAANRRSARPAHAVRMLREVGARARVLHDHQWGVARQAGRAAGRSGARSRHGVTRLARCGTASRR